MADLDLFNPPPDADPVPEAEAPDGEKRERLFLLDALALAYRAHFAFINRPLINKKGMDTSAVYGFTGALLKILEDHSPEHIAVVFDAIGEGGTFRDEMYAQYKAHRPPMPDGLKGGLPVIKDIVRAFDIPAVEIPGVEADDVIGTLARRAEGEDVDVIIVSPDKDFRQLLSDRDDHNGGGSVSMLRPAYKGEAFDLETADSFRDTYGVEPVQFIDILALLGDASDNVPGVRGIGKKTAPQLVQDYGTVENLLDHVDEITAKRVQNGLKEHADDARLSKKLVTILTDVDLGTLDWHDLKRTDPDIETVEAIFDEMEFGQRLRSRIQRYADGRPPRKRRSYTTLPEDDPSLEFDFGPYEPVRAMDEDAVEYETLLSKGKLDRARASMEGHERFAFDTETTSVNAMEASLVGISLSHAPRQGVYAPTPMPDGTPTEAVLQALKEGLEDPASEKVGHNVKYDLVVLARHGQTVGGPLFDTMIAHYLVSPEESHKLDDVSSFYLSYRPQPITELIGSGKDALSMRDVPVEQVGPYACEDADVALRLQPLLKAKLEEDGLLEIAETIEFPLVRVLADVEMAGVKIDTDVLAEISTTLGAEMERLEGEITEHAGRTFNIGSPKQLGEILFNAPPSEEERAAAKVWAVEIQDPKAAGKTKKQLREETPTFGLGLEPRGKTRTGQPKTDESVLSELAAEHPLPAAVLDWRKLSKLKSTYVDKLPELVHPETGRVHTDFNQAVTATGRLSSSNPNLQNIPIRTDVGKEIRRAFVAEEGHVLVVADYAQIELRILAHMSSDPGLIEAFQNDLDIHSATAARVFSVELESVTRAMRSQVKQVNYGIPYGVSAFGLAQRMRIGNKEAQKLIDQYRAAYPDVIHFLDSLIEDARAQGYVETLLGRRRYIPQIRSSSPTDRAYAERIAVNMPIQGTQADMIKIAMVAIHRRLKDEGFASRMILQVHDELVFEAPQGEVDRLAELVREEMTGALPLGVVPVEVDIGVADNWLDAH